MRAFPLIGLMVLAFFGAGCTTPVVTAPPQAATHTTAPTVPPQAETEEYDRSIEELAQEEQQELDRLRQQDQAEMFAEQQGAIETPAAEGVRFE